jgi:HK97 family phage major capsid protein
MVPVLKRNEEFFVANLQELAIQRKHALAKTEAILTAAETGKRELTREESIEFDNQMTAVNVLSKKIEGLQKNSTLRNQMVNGMLIPAGAGAGAPRSLEKKAQTLHLTEEYLGAFSEWIQSGCSVLSTALYEGSDGAGGYAVPIVVDDQIVPLAPQEMAVRQLASVIPTTSDIKFPIKAAFGTAATKAETSSFAGTALTLGQFTLTANMIGSQNDVSWELAQDVPNFQSFELSDQIIAQQMLEESYYVNGTGTGQPQGLIGNVGAGVTEEPDTNGNLVSISGTLDLLGTLNEVYHAGASFLMTRATSIIIRKAQTQANLFEPVWTRENGKDYLHGYPVAFSASMPTAAHGACPVLFGDFKRGYVIGDRGGSGINVKVLDQPKAAQGLITLLAYRRTDGRVRRSEAIQSYNVALLGS